ncbi:hypothetical protein ABVN21_18320 [Pseudomonas sp. MYb327]|uniref:Diguanylate cyclase n=1 Tax=Pseudomonas sp. MYb327 TaxID=2745230 RepID=A0AAU8EAF9_9PSED
MCGPARHRAGAAGCGLCFRSDNRRPSGSGDPVPAPRVSSVPGCSGRHIYRGFRK